MSRRKGEKSEEFGQEEMTRAHTTYQNNTTEMSVYTYRSANSTIMKCRRKKIWGSSSKK
jgi:hypothetical protein